jgi:hypothetical protein
MLNFSTAIDNIRWNVGIKRPPIIVATVHERMISLKSNKLGLTPMFIFFSMVLANNGAWNPLAVLDINTSILKRAKETAILPVRMPTILTEYESVVIRLIRKVSPRTRMI